MNRTEYANKVVEELNKEGIQAVAKEILKDNVKKIGIIINQGSISPTFYIDENKNMKEFIDMIKNFKTPEINKTSLEDIFKNKNEFLKRIIPDLMNEEKNKDMECIKRKLNNGLIMIVRADVKDIVPNGKIKITQKIIDKLGISENELFEAAISNMNKEEYQIVDVIDIISQPGSDFNKEHRNELLMISNKENVNGAVFVLHKEVEQELKNRLGEFIILPSSRHEVLAVKRSELEKLKCIVMSVNNEVVSDEDYLSDDIFELINGKLLIA